MASTKHKVNNMTPGAKDAALGDKVAGVITLVNSIKAALLYMTLAKAGLAIGATSPKKGVTIANTVTYLINGVPKTKTTAEIAFTATVHDIAANASVVREAVYLLSLAANGNATITKGVEATGAGKALVPDCPSGQAPIGHVRIAVAAGATSFDATSDDLDAGHLTVTYTDLGFIPDKLGADVEALT